MCFLGVNCSHEQIQLQQQQQWLTSSSSVPQTRLKTIAGLRQDSGLNVMFQSANMVRKWKIDGKSTSVLPPVVLRAAKDEPTVFHSQLQQTRSGADPCRCGGPEGSDTGFIRTVAEPERRALMRSLFEVAEALGENEAPALFRLSQRGWTEAPPTFPAAAPWTPPPALFLPPTDIRSRLNFLPLRSSAQRSDYGLSARL